MDSKQPIKTKKSLASLAEKANQNHIIIFPEGRRTPNGHLQHFKRGFIYLLRNSHLDLLPVTLNGFYQLKPMKRLYLDPDTKLEIIVHKTLTQANIQNLTDEELLKLTVETIKKDYKP